MGEIKFVGALLMTAIFSLAMTYFAISFAYDNSASFSLAGQPGYNETLSQVGANITYFSANITNASGQFMQSTIEEGDTSKTGGQFKLGPGSALQTVDGVFKQGFSSIFGNDNAFSFVFTSLMAFLGLVMFLLLWKTWGGRNPE